MLRWLQSTANGQATPHMAPVLVEEQACPGMARVLKRILSKRDEQPEVLDLGQHSRSAAVYLANRGARVCVEDFEPPHPAPKKRKGEAADAAVKDPVVIPYPDGKFDLVLAWEHWDFVPPERLADFAAEVERILAPGGWLLMYCRDNPKREESRRERPACYRLTSDDRLAREPKCGDLRRRWGHQNRTIERALGSLRVQAIQLQRNRMREFLVRKPTKVPSG